jgi:hypothetical protein
MKQPGMTLMVGAYTFTVPNFKAEALTLLKLSQPSPLLMWERVVQTPLNIARENTARAQLKNTFQIIANFQKVLGLDIS